MGDTLHIPDNSMDVSQYKASDHDLDSSEATISKLKEKLKDLAFLIEYSSTGSFGLDTCQIYEMIREWEGEYSRINEKLELEKSKL